ncbi:DUF2934 domain-containing protein [Steroidobacter sp.]|uniref:DUF2934 domain-containing protein n=1 Tax=Steroidobacter sp. TaxID=1978227 RepID=UPI001A5A1C29|nr:DUF2934 domain-containing protein [Steroidobacter sp.]MBL8265561.1 DUF2934 domain-containing protein [Steroidobacter sp.]
MASRPSSPTPRSKKSSTRTLPPVTTVTNEERTLADAEETAENRAADGVVGEVPTHDSSHDVKITGSKLDQREIPSFSESREARIAEAAYWRAERRGFEPGHELDDWLHAEQEVDTPRHS